MDELVSVSCVENLEPPRVRVCLAVFGCIDIPKDFYDTIREQMGWPDIVCGEG